MEWKKRTVLLPDHTSLTVLDTAGAIDSGLVFCLKDPLCREASGILETMAEFLALKHIAVAVPRFSGDQGLEEAELRIILDSLKDAYHSFAPWFCFYAEGRFCRPAALYINGEDKSQPPILHTLLVFPDIVIREQEPHLEDIRFTAEGYDTFVRKGRVIFSTVLPSPDEPEKPDALRIASYFIRLLDYTRRDVWKFVLETLDGYDKDSVPLEAVCSVLCEMVRQGCGEAALRLQRLEERTAEDTPVQPETVTAEDTLIAPETPRRYDTDLDDREKTREMLNQTRYAIEGEFPSIWQERCFWTAAASDLWPPSGHARRILFARLLHDLKGPEAERTVLRLKYAVRDGHSYAAVFLGLLAEMENPPNLETARNWYEMAAGSLDPEGDYRIGRLIEYGLHQREQAESFYRKASDAGYLPAMAKMTSYLEQQEDPAQIQWELMDLYEMILREGTFSAALRRYGELLEKEGRVQEAEEAYEAAWRNGQADKAEEEKWDYQVGTDRNGIFFTEYGIWDKTDSNTRHW